MCKHIAFDRNRWAPCAVCVVEKQNASTIKNQAAIRAEIAEIKVYLAECEAKGRWASAESAKQDIEHAEKRLRNAGLPV